MIPSNGASATRGSLALLNCLPYLSYAGPPLDDSIITILEEYIQGQLVMIFCFVSVEPGNDCSIVSKVSVPNSCARVVKIWQALSSAVDKRRFIIASAVWPRMHFVLQKLFAVVEQAL